VLASGLVRGHIDPSDPLLEKAGASNTAQNIEAGRQFIDWSTGADAAPERPDALSTPEDVQALIFNDHFDARHFALHGETQFSGQVAQIAMEAGNLNAEQLETMNEQFQAAGSRFEQQKVLEEHLGLKAASPGDWEGNWNAMQQRTSGFSELTKSDHEGGGREWSDRLSKMWNGTVD